MSREKKRLKIWKIKKRFDKILEGNFKKNYQTSFTVKKLINIVEKKKELIFKRMVV